MKKFLTFWTLTIAMLIVALGATVLGSFFFVLSIFGTIKSLELVAKIIFIFAQDFFTWAEKFHYGAKLDAQPVQDPAAFLTPEEKKIAEWAYAVAAIKKEADERWKNRKKDKQFRFTVSSGNGETLLIAIVTEHCEHCAVVAGIDYVNANGFDTSKYPYIKYSAKELTA